MDKGIYFIGVLGPVMTIPQVLEIWTNKNASGVSLLSWGSYFFFSLFWTAYGFAHNEKPIIISSILSILVQGLVIVGVLFFG